MTIPELIANTLEAVRSKFYADRPREFLRDERALTGAISTWGYECNQRGWDFTPQFIFKDIMGVLLDIQRRGADVKYLPVYLQGAVRRHIGQRAEELQAAGRDVRRNVKRIVNGVEVAVIVEKTNTEVLSALYTDLKRQQRTRKARPVAKVKQGELL